MENEKWEELFQGYRNAVERFVYFKIPIKADAEDILQEVFLTAFQKFSGLRDPLRFKAWMLSIARSKCADYYRSKTKSSEIPLDSLPEGNLVYGRLGFAESSPVRETLALLEKRDREILGLTYFGELSQAEIARRLQIPLGTVKSRLHTAKAHFREKYPFSPATKGAFSMKKLPEFLPEYTIDKSEKEPFSVKWEELMGWFLVPKLGEKLSWGIYDMPSRKCDRIYDMEVTGKAEVHGIQGVELIAKESDCSKKQDTIEYTFVAQLTDTHCRYLAAMRTENGIRRYITFLDGENFLPNWGFGENNCGNETNLSPKGDICRNGNEIQTSDKKFLLDIVGRYTVKIDGKSYDTVCVMDIETYNFGVVGEQFLDQNGRTILWRRFNRDDWAFHRYGKRWTEILPDNQRLTINGETYVHWYDCITNYIL